MAKPQIKYKTQLSSLTKGGKPCYIIRVVNNGTEYLSDSSQMKEIARLINMNEPFAKTTTQIVLKKAIELALTGKRVETEMFSTYLTGRGGFMKTSEKWNPAKHSLHLVINLKGELKAKLADIEFVNVSEGIKVALYSVGDEIWAEDGVIAGTAGSTVKIVCDNGKILTGRDDEGVWLLDLADTVVQRLTVTNSTEQTCDATVPETVPAGEYKVMLAARNGEGLERGVGVAYRKIAVKGAK